MSVKKRFLVSFVLLLAGSVTYVLFRENTLFVSALVGDYRGPLYEFGIAHSANPVCYFLAYCLSDALWYAALVMVQKPFMVEGALNRLLFWVSVALPFGLELGQLAGWLPGTFDVFDVLTYLITFLIAYRI